MRGAPPVRRVAARFRALGWTATPEILEAPRGFFRAAGGGYDPKAIVGKLGAPWTFRSPGVSIKPHPSGSLTHPGMTEMLRLIRANNIKARTSNAWRVGTNRNMPNALIHHQPKTGLEAKFSMEFCMALLLYGKAGLGEFQDEVVNRPEVRSYGRAHTLRRASGGRGGGLQQDDDDHRHPAAERQEDFRARGFRQGQPGESDEPTKRSRPNSVNARRGAGFRNQTPRRLSISCSTWSARRALGRLMRLLAK